MAGEKRENLEFVQFIERYPCLYDHTCKSYSYETDKTWQAVADEFQMTGEFNTTKQLIYNS